MSRYWALCRREWLEHRSALIWTPLGVTALLILAAVTAVLTNADWLQERQSAGATMTGVQLRHLLHMTTIPAQAILFFTSAFYLLGTLFDERRDRTVLFWKSLPVRDSEAVLAKLAVVLLITPAIAFICIGMLQLTATTLIAAFCPCDAIRAQPIWSAADLVDGTAHWLLGLLTQSLWWLPLWSWLLLVSAAAPRLPIIWALLVPPLVAVLELILLGSRYFWPLFEARLDTPALPDYVHTEGGGTIQSITLDDTLALWSSVEFWAGLIVAAALLVLTVCLRRRLNEL